MKLVVNNTTELDVIGCGHLTNGRTTIMMRNTDTFATLANLFDGIETLDATQVRGVDHLAGKASLVAIHRNEGSEIVSVTLSGLRKRGEFV